MNNWEKVTLSELGKIITGKTPKTAISENYGDYIQFLTPSDDMNIKYCTYTNRMLSKVGLKEVSNNLLPANSICVSCIGSDLGKVIITTKETVTNQQINSIIVNENYNVDFVYYAMLILGKKMNFISKTSTAVPIINKSTFSNYTINIPVDKDEQKRIADVLSALDDKIEINNKINENLEAQAQAIFKQWFVDFEFPDTEGKPYKTNGGKFIDSELGEIPIGWKVGTLTQIASYLNGLAMQKFRPEKDEKGFPVLKIKELRQGCCDSSSDLCSERIDSNYIINNGNIVFSWSGTLMIDFWTGGVCGLNQHLFKVESKKYEDWFVFLWTKYHLEDFIRIAKDKAVTMGHIKREHLDKAMILIPTNEIYNNVTNILKPIFSSIINLRIENKNLSEIRDSLLPKLMSGEVRV